MLVLRNQDNKITGFSDRKEICKVMFLKLTGMRRATDKSNNGYTGENNRGKTARTYPEAVLESVKNDSKFPVMNLIMCEKKANISFWHLM